MKPASGSCHTGTGIQTRSGGDPIAPQSKKALTRSSLVPVQRQTVEVIETLTFGVIEGLEIRGGLPCYELEPRITQTIRIGPEAGNQFYPGGDLTLKKEFVILFEQMRRLRDARIDIEVRHGAPFKLVVVRRYAELLR
jgi:hypothetical protein